MPALKNFGITFLIAAIIFSVVAYFLVGFLTSTVTGILDAENDKLDSLFADLSDETTDPAKKDSSKIPVVEGDSYTVMFAMTDKRTEIFKYFPQKQGEINGISIDPATAFGMLSTDYRTVKVKSIVLVRVSKETGEYSIILVPPISKVYTQMGAGSTLLEDVMYFYDKEYFVQKVSAMTGITPDYTFFVNITNMDDVMSAIGGFTCKVGDDIYSDGKDYFPEPPEETTVSETTPPETEKSDKSDDKKKEETTTEKKVEIKKMVSRGNVTVGASNVEAILLYDGYADDGIDLRYANHIEFVKGLLGKLSGFSDSQLSSVYGALISSGKVESDMTEAQLLKKAELIRAYKDFTVTTFEYPGTVTGDSFDPNTAAAVKEYLGLRLPPDPAKAG